MSIAKDGTELALTYHFAAPDVAAIRKKKLEFSQEKFGGNFGLPAATIRDWEQKRRHPDAPARNLLRVIAYAPETVERAIAAE